MAVTITDSFRPINETVLADFETRINAKLPSEYREFLLAQNGGDPQPSSLNIKTNTETLRTAVRFFLAISTSDDERGQMRSFDLMFQLIKGRIPENLLPIAVDVVSNVICMSTSGEDYGQIYFWDRDWEPEEQPDYSNIYFIAKSFNEFLGMLFQRTDI